MFLKPRGWYQLLKIKKKIRNAWKVGDKTTGEAETKWWTHADKSTNRKDMTPCQLVNEYQCFKRGSWTSLILKVQTASCSKTSVTIYQSIWCQIPEELNLRHHQCENLRSRTMQIGRVTQCVDGRQWHVIIKYRARLVTGWNRYF